MKPGRHSRSDHTKRERRGNLFGEERYIQIGGESMTSIYTATIKQDGDWWIGWIEEVPGVNCQEKSRAELLKSLKITLREALEFNRQDAIAAAGGKYQEEHVAV